MGEQTLSSYEPVVKKSVNFRTNQEFASISSNTDKVDKLGNMHDQLENRVEALERKLFSLDDSSNKQRIDISDLERRVCALESVGMPINSSSSNLQILSDKVVALEAKISETEVKSETAESSTTVLSQNDCSSTTVASKLEIPNNNLTSMTTKRSVVSSSTAQKHVSSSTTKVSSSTTKKSASATTLASQADLPNNNETSVTNVKYTESEVEIKPAIKVSQSRAESEVSQRPDYWKDQVRKLSREKQELLRHNKYNIKRKNELKDEISRLEREIRDFQTAIIEVGQNDPRVDINLESVMGSEFDISHTTQSGIFPKPSHELYRERPSESMNEIEKTRMSLNRIGLNQNISLM